MIPVRARGFILTELLVTGLIAAFLMLGIVQMAAGVSRGLLLIESGSDTLQGGRFVIEQIRNSAMSAAFNPTPWEPEARINALGHATADGGTGANDILMLRQWSDRNCYGNANSTTDALGNPVFFLLDSKFEVTSGGNLAHSCWYGPDDSSMTRQINRLGIVQGVESFQVLYAEDTDADRQANRLVRAGRWNDIDRILGLEIGLLVGAEKTPGGGSPALFSVLDETVTPPQDGRIRKTWTASIPLVSKLR